jgi:hypothetical protein
MDFLARLSPIANLLAQLGFVLFTAALVLGLGACSAATPPPVIGAPSAETGAEAPSPGLIGTAAAAAADRADTALAKVESGIDAAQLVLGLGEAARIVPADRAARLRATLDQARDLAGSARSLLARGDVESALRVIGEARGLADRVHRLGAD